MQFFQNVTEVTFGFTDHVFNVSSVFCSFSLFGRPFTIYWYALIIAFGMTLAVLFGGRIAWVWRIDLGKMVDVFLCGLMLGIVGARLYYVFSKWDYFSRNIAEIPKIWNGGLAIYGGIIGGLLGAYLYSRKAKINFLNLLDLIGMSLLIGQGIGRWGNFANQEAFGTNTSSVFGMHSEKIADYIVSHSEFFAAHNIRMDPDMPVHPTFLYESVWCLAGFLILYIILKTCRKFSGQMFLLYGIWYGLGRAVIEGFRTDSLYIGSTDIRVSQALSMSIVFVCAVLLVYNLVRYKKNPKPVEGVDFFPEGSRIPKKERSAADK